MNDAEISRRLALAIGWPEPDVSVFEPLGDMGCMVSYCGLWRTFDYRDPAVIWPIAERLNVFPWKACDCWWAATRHSRQSADTAAKAVALAVIKAHEKQK